MKIYSVYMVDDTDGLEFLMGNFLDKDNSLNMAKKLSDQDLLRSKNRKRRRHDRDFLITKDLIVLHPVEGLDNTYSELRRRGFWDYDRYIVKEFESDVFRKSILEKDIGLIIWENRTIEIPEDVEEKYVPKELKKE